MKHREHFEPVSLDEINIQLERNLKQISKLVSKRKELITLKLNRLENQYKIQLDALNRGDKNITMEIREADKELNSLLTSVQQNPRLRSTLNGMWSQSISNISKNQNSRNAEFWNVNRRLENDIVNSLKKLKVVDQNIKVVVSQLYKIGESIDETDQKIRQILSMRYQNHIQKAEPYSIQRNKLQNSLQAKYQQKQKIKQQKLQIIKKLVVLLEHLESHRQSHLKQLFPIEQADMVVYSHFLEGLQKIVRTKQSLNSSQQVNTQSKLATIIFAIQDKSDQLINSYFKKQAEENQALDDLTKYYANKLRAVSLQKVLIGDIIPEYASKNLAESIKKCRQFRRILEQSNQQKSTVRQGLQKTKQTAQFFDKVLRSIQSERTRMKKLMREIKELQEQYDNIQLKQQSKIKLVSQLQQVALKKKQLQKRLKDLATRADLQGYKKISQSMQQLKEDEVTIENQLNKANELLMSGSSGLEQFAHGLNTQYNDILKELLPENWLRKHDLRKSDNILQLNRYLQKTFDRLSL